MDQIPEHAGRAVVLIGPPGVRHGMLANPGAVRAVEWTAPCRGQAGNTLLLDHQKLPELAAGEVPLFAAVASPGGGWMPYTRTAYCEARSLMLALDGPALAFGDPDEPATVQAWADDLVSRHRQVGPQVTNHQRWFVNARPGLEIEHKFTLTEQGDIWPLAIGVLDALHSGQIPGWVPEYGNNDGFEEWDFLNHLFAFDEPAGHVAFIPAVDGTWIIREKWGPPDTPRVRAEKLTSGVQLGPEPDLESLVWKRYQLRPVWRGGYRRIRYNVMLESPHTGHIFSIMLDHCVDLDGRRDDLHQVEVEYVRSRTLRRPPAEHDALMEQLEELIAWTRTYLRDHVKTREDHLAKISWLRPAADPDRPP
ncbi:hypothetical protein [Nonomuraea jabiensis]|uniref:hypothetical protein n=1 Tax=Nonomuraea jabiensis TaxID=882448 RepID=UPI003D71253C